MGLELRLPNKDNVRKITREELMASNAFHRLIKKEQFKNIDQEEQKYLKKYLLHVIREKLLISTQSKNKTQQILISTILEAISKADFDIWRAERKKRRYLK